MTAGSVPPPGDMAQIEVRDEDGVTIAALSGELDISNVEEIAARLTTLPNAALGLVVDLSAVEYMDSSGISLLHDLAVRMRRRSQQLTVVCPPESPPRRVLELTGLVLQTPVVDELAAAIQVVRAVYEEPEAL